MLKVHIHTHFSKTKLYIYLPQPTHADKIWFLSLYNTRLVCSDTLKQQTLNSGIAPATVAPITLQKNTGTFLQYRQTLLRVLL